MGIQCKCSGIVKIKDGTKRIRPSGAEYKRTTRQCGKRKTLSKHPEDYIRQPACPDCGSRNWTVDTFRIRRLRSGVDNCNCGGYSFQHRKGSKFCYFHPEAEKNHSERYEKSMGIFD